MYIVSIPENFTRADGKPFRKNKEDNEGREIRRLDKVGNPIATKVGQIEIPEYETERASFADMLIFFLNNLFGLVAIKARDNKEIKSLGFEDSSLATDCLRAIHIAEKTLELEKHPYEWLMKMITTWGSDIQLFGVNAAVILEPFKQAQEEMPTRAEKKRAENV